MAIPKYMQQDSQGPVVQKLQEWLKKWYEDPDIVADGDYGDNTARLVGKIQIEAHMKKDGHCGPATRRRMKRRMGFDLEAVARTTHGVTIFVQPEGDTIYWSAEVPEFMTKGSEGPGVVKLQEFLVRQGHGQDIVVDGIFGRVTQDRLIDYMGMKGAESATGKCGPKTREFFKNDGFDFDAELMETSGTTIFVQLDGTKIEWSPESSFIPADVADVATA